MRTEAEVREALTRFREWEAVEPYIGAKIALGGAADALAWALEVDLPELEAVPDSLVAKFEQMQ